VQESHRTFFTIRIFTQYCAIPHDHFGVKWPKLEEAVKIICQKDDFAFHDSLAIRGPYRFMRHPLYFFSLLMIWSCPDVGADRLLFNGLWTLWIIIGTILEERDLVREFGASYRQYQRTTPMLIPWKFVGRGN